MQNNKKIFVYCLEPQTERSVKIPIVPLHLQYLDSLRKKGMLVVSGAFEYKSGVLVSFVAESLEEAKKIANNDPFIKEKVDKLVWIKEWNVNIEDFSK